jgi:pilus assembly protein Flp/PilA
MVRRRNKNDDIGASSVEYGLLIALIAAVIVVAVLAFGTMSGDLFSGTCKSVNDGVVSAGHGGGSCP